MDIKRVNQLIMLVANDNRDACQNDEERKMYDQIKAEQDWLNARGRGLDVINDSTV